MAPYGLVGELRLVPAPHEHPPRLVAITVARVKLRTVKVSSTVPFASRTTQDGDLYRGQTRTVTAGHAGTRVVSYLETWVDGKRESRKATTAASRVSDVSLILVPSDLVPLAERRPASMPRK